MREPTAHPHHPSSLTWAVLALAGATLMLEGGLLRLLAVAQFYHFAFLVVSLALLGFGASGSLLAVSTRLSALPLDRLMAACGLAFGATTGLAYLTVNFLPFDSYTIAWERVQLLYFVLYYLALTLPFLCSGLAIGAALSRSRGTSHRIYAANLVGSALGAALGLAVQALAGVPGVVLAAALLGLLPLLWSRARRIVLALLALGLLALALLAGLFLDRAPLGLVVSPYKGLAHMLRYPGAQSIFGRWNAYARVDVIADAGTRQLPGLSYTYPGVPPPQHGLSVDAGARQPVTLVSPQAFDVGAYLPEGLAFHLRPTAEVLVLEPGGGLGVLQALAGGAARVTGVLGNPLVRRGVARTAATFDVYAHPKVRTVLEPGRVFLERDSGRYDLVLVPLTDPYQPVTNGAYSLAETYMLTREAVTAMLDRLAPRGMLVMTRWAQIPPSESLRMVATVVEALERRGQTNPGDALLVYRGVQTVTLLVQPDGWSQDELARVRPWLENRRYDLVWAPDIRPEEVNRFNRLPEPAYFQAVQDLVTAADRQAFYRSYPFAIDPPTDDRPFFFHFFTWAQTEEVLAALGRTWQPFGGSGYFVLFVFLGLALLLSLGLILGPLLTMGRGRAGSLRPLPAPGWGIRFRALGYFVLLGLAFLLVEIPLIQRWILLLGHASYAFAAVVTALLLGAGVGSLLARRLGRSRGFWPGLVMLALLTPFATDALIQATLGWSLLLRGGVAVLALLPLAVLMGVPFPLGLTWLEEDAPSLVPWAWAVNGCASVTAAVLAAILALGDGFTLVLSVGAAAYAGAGLLMFSRRRPS